MDPRRTPPDLDATGSPGGLPSEYPRRPGEREPPGRETLEREAARRRGRARRSAGAAGHDPEVGRADPELVHHAFAALAENVRDYAVFLLDADGIIRFWGEGARLMKRWAKEEAEGAHLRFLYPDGGADDGTAEDHLLDAAKHGESVSEGQRVRGDGKTFWARITLTALRNEEGKLLGFAKVTIDLTVQRAANAERALARLEANRARSVDERAELKAELEVLQEELAVLRKELEERDRPVA
ncbi:MAG TPA: PAS domain-containing protein [Gemmatimonadaceae bacterium]|nr:PAS domain-containing protein [Gemmatimonadaceae bacterium]